MKYAIVVILVLGTAGLTQADVKSQAVREAAEIILRKLGKEAAKDGAEALAQRIEVVVTRHGEEVLLALRKGGPAALHAMETAGPHGGAVAMLFARCGEDAAWVIARPNRTAIFIRHGDEAAEALIRHRAVAEPLIETFERPAVRALNAVNGPNARRLGMMLDDGELARLSQPRGLLEVVGRYGDRAMEFVWKHKGALTVTAALTTFLAEPEPFLDGTRDLTRVVAESAVRPVAQVPGQVAQEAARSVNWNTLAVLGMLLVASLVMLRWPVKREIK